MTKTGVMALLKSNRNDRGAKNWKKLGADTEGLKSFGIGLTLLRKLAKQIDRDHKLAWQLWKTDNHDAKVVGLLIDDPKKLTREQVEEQVEGVGAGSLRSSRSDQPRRGLQASPLASACRARRLPRD